MLRQPLLFGYWLPRHPVFDSPLMQSVRLPMVTYGAMPLVARFFSANPYLGGAEDSPGVRGILSIASVHIPNLSLTKRDIVVGS